MNAVNAVQLFILVRAFSAVCQADKNVSCDNVTGSVGKEVNLTCSISCPNCSIEKYKFQYPKIFNDSAICKENFTGNCEQSNDFRCRYTPTTAMTQQFRFFVQTKCGTNITEFTVSITASSSIKAEHKSKDIVIAAVVGCFILIIIIIMTIICNKKPNFIKPCGFQKRMFLCIKHDEDNSDHPEDVIEQH